jgi:hypothetical protein
MNKMLINKPSCRQACFFVYYGEEEREREQPAERTRLDSRLDLDRFGDR